MPLASVARMIVPAVVVAGFGMGLTVCASAETEDPLALFTKMYPVFSHERCTGCHGRVNPELASGNNHSMGQYTDTRECVDCHVAAPGWKTRRDLLFHGRTAKQLCKMQDDHLARMRSSAAGSGLGAGSVNEVYLRHLSQDDLIGHAFAGLSGGATGQVARPATNRREFVAAGKAWLDGGAGCGGWRGTLKQEESFGSNYTYPIAGMAPPSSNHVNETAQRKFEVKREDGATTATVTASGHGVVVQTLHMGSCMAVNTSDGSWRTTTPQDIPVPLDIKIAADGSYTIKASGPPETGNGNTTGTHRNDCGIPIPGPQNEPPSQLEWPPWLVTIRCPSPDTICQPYDPKIKLLKGTRTLTLRDHLDAAEPQSWLTTSPAGISRSDDGTSIPVTVTTTWDLTLEE